jgi:hypothetical protein
MIGFIVILLLLAVAVGAAYYYYTQTTEPSTGPSTQTTEPELVITEDGASLTENYRIMPKREKYIQMPRVADCQKGTKSEMCNAYDKNDGFAFVYDLSLADAGSPRYENCPGGGHDCWYTEKYDEEGTLIAVTDKNGVSMLDKIADDIWSDKWSMEHRLVSEMSDAVEFKDGTLKAKRLLTFGGGQKVEVGEVVKPTDLPSSMYFIALFTSMKNAGEEKPAKITLKVKGAKDYFNKFVKGSSTIEQTQNPQKKSTKPFKVELYDKADCTGEVVRAVQLNVGIPLDAVVNVKSEEGSKKACCMKVSNANVTLDQNTWAKNDKGEHIKMTFPSNRISEEEKIELNGCSSNYSFRMSPLT